MKIAGIYRIQSKIKPERIYIGSSMNIERRWKIHMYELGNGKHINPKLQNHYNKYGKDDLVFSIIVGCDNDNLIAMEQFYLDAIDPWFNICPTAGNTRGRPVSDETRDKLRKANIGRPSWNKGKTFSEEHKRNIGRSMKGEKNPMYGRPAPIKGTRGKYPNKWKGKTGRYSEEVLVMRGLANKKAWEKRKQKKEEESCQG
jgi:group I intron endonuclease